MKARVYRVEHGPQSFNYRWGCMANDGEMHSREVYCIDG